MAVGGIGSGVYLHSYLEQKAAEEAAAAVDYSLKPLTIDQLVGGNYYIKDGDTFYAVAPGILYSTGEALSIPTAASPNERILMFGPDDEQIPTLYKDTQLIYKSADFNNPSSDGTVPLTPTEYILERFSDQGYSVGIRGLENPDGTKYRTSIVKTSFYPGSSAIANLKLKQDEILTLDKINGVPISSSNVSSVGTITGLTKGNSYTLDAYIGTSPVGGDVIADTHMFASFELYSLKDYELDAAGYGIITMPDYMWSGYYYINGMGLFRYINDYKAYGVSSDIDYNVAYFMGKDKAGNIITNPAPTVVRDEVITDETGTTTDIATGEVVADSSDPFTYHYKVTIDNQQKSMNISIEYSEAMTYTDSNGDGEYDIIKASDGVLIPGASTPAAVLTSPSGQTYTMTNMGAIQDGAATSLSDMAAHEATDTEELASNSLNATIDNPEVGTWNVDITGMYARVFTISTSYAGSSTNMVVKDSSNATNMVVYVPENLTDAVFKFTWDELGHTGTFTVTGPDNKKIATNSRNNDNQYDEPDQVLLEQYGEVDLLIGEAVAGEYKIKITGESLGHVYWNYIDRADGDNTVGESDNATDAASAESSEEDTDDDATTDSSK
ncbi:hypothetical protein [Butyrivibrio sp.]|uniref:hypothetical protein n=1 Tax=Butyrivibrio sp. TaxID=28121 RepID=UPI0025BCD3B5|nr:hypothetical protein [Butyrivibrio sp.]MBQ9303164.1 hypothetical protein [Butyrivibrio sp.]